MAEIAINKALKGLATKNSEYVEANLRFESPGSIAASVVKRKGGSPGSQEKIPTDEKIKEVIQAAAKANGKDIATEKITIDPVVK